MSTLLKSLSPAKDAVSVALAAPALIQELWDGRQWVNPKVFLQAAQATLACLAVQALGEEDSQQSVELQWAWGQTGLTSLYADSLFQGVVRTSYSWIGDESEELSELAGTFQMRRKESAANIPQGHFVPSQLGIVDSGGDIVADVQNILDKSEQIDCALAISVRWAIEEKDSKATLKITMAHAYLLHVLPPALEAQRSDNLAYWNNYLKSLGSPGDWALSEETEKATQEMNQLIFASPHGMKLFSKALMFYCNCSEEKIIRILKTLPKEDLEDLEKTFEVSCKYCGKIYNIENSKL